MKTTKPARQEAQTEYERQQKEIRKLLKKLEAGLEKHDSKVGQAGHHWGHVGDLGFVIEKLTRVSDFVNGTGEYAG
jgi:hypothetical protein